MSLLEDFKLNKVLSLEHIMDKYQVSKRTVQGDVESFKAMGYAISVARSGEHKGKFVLDEEGSSQEAVSDGVYDAMRGMLGDMVILINLQDENGKKLLLTHDELYRKVRYDEYDVSNQMYYGDRSTWYTNAIARLKEAKCIREKSLKRDGRAVRAYELGINAPRFVRWATGKFGEVNSFFYEATDRMSEYNEEQGSSVSKVLAKMQVHFNGMIDEQSSCYIKRERLDDEESALEQIKAKLVRYSYMTKALEISYTSVKGFPVTESVKVAMLVFAKSTNKLYIVGESIESSMILYIPVQQITDIAELDVKNDLYGSKQYTDLLKYMFGAAGMEHIDDAIDVEVEFKIFGNVVNKLEKLVESRNRYGVNAKLIYNEDTVTYIDKINSIYDIMAYLRSFGSSCTIIRPLELRDKMVESANMVLEQYRKEGYKL